MTASKYYAKFQRPGPVLENQTPIRTHAQVQVVQCCSFFAGMSLDSHADELRHFLARDVDDPATIVDKHVSDCGLFALAVWHALEVQDLRLTEKYQMGMAIAWLVNIAGLHGAIRHPIHDGIPTVGALLHWQTHGKPDDHVSFLTKAVTLSRGQWLGECIGGGGKDCAINRTAGNVLWSWGRPLQAWYDINALLPEYVGHGPLLELEPEPPD
jgi:hypothetical protein